MDSTTTAKWCQFDCKPKGQTKNTRKLLPLLHHPQAVWKFCEKHLLLRGLICLAPFFVLSSQGRQLLRWQDSVQKRETKFRLSAIEKKRHIFGKFAGEIFSPALLIGVIMKKSLQLHHWNPPYRSRGPYTMEQTNVINCVA